MKKLFATGIIYICLFILLIAGVYNFGKKLNENAIQDDEVVATTENTKNRSGSTKENAGKSNSQKESGEEGGKSDSGSNESAGIEDKVVVKGDISEGITPFNYKTTADKYLLDLCYAGLCEMKDRRCISKNISSIYHEKKNVTTYRITLNENEENTAGDKITADDVLFNYYLRADAGFTADGGISGLPIAGLQEYRYGTRNIKSVKKKISKKLKKPDKKTASLIRKNIIRPVLEEEFEWVCSLYKQEMYDYITDKYPRKKDLFVYFFAYGTDYKTKGKTVQKVINDVIKSYGTNYNKLGKITGENYKKKAESIALYSIQTDKKFKFHVNNISGIRKIDGMTIEITVKGKRKAGFINRLCNMYIVSMESWGNPALFNGIDSFGLKRGKAKQILKEKAITGDETGNYAVKEIKDGVYTLEKRKLI